jgi:hypothetical protein
VGDNAVREAIAGVWSLVAYEDRDAPEDAWTTPYGEQPLGLGVYDRSGLVSIQVFADPNSRLAAASVAYIGTYVIREAVADQDGFRGMLEHHMQAASSHDLLQEDPARPFVVTSDKLMLGDGVTWRRIFTRL